MRVTWHGTLSFGLVNVPVGLAVSQDRETVRFRQIHRGCGERVRMPKSCPVHGELTMDEVVKGYEYEEGRFLEVEEADLDEARPSASKTIAIRAFVRQEEIDPRVLDRTYFLVPAKETAQREGYALLAAAMEQKGVTAIAEFVLWGRENLCSVRSQEGRLMLDLLFRPEDLRDSGVVDKLVDGVSVSKEALALAVSIVESEIEIFDHAKYGSTYAEDLRATLDARAKGKPKARPKAAPKVARDEDLVSALRATLAAARGDAEPAKKKPAPRKKKVAV